MDIWLIVSLSIGIFMLFILFLFVFKAKKKFSQVKAILKPIQTQSGIRVVDVWASGTSSEEFSGARLEEYGTYAYFPTAKVVAIEEECLFSNSLFDVTAVSHEMGHAKAHGKGSGKMAVWYALTCFERGVCWSILPLFLIGFILSWFGAWIGNLGTLFMNISTAFTIMILLNRVITIPTEKEASNYGLQILEESNALTKNELEMSRKMLNVALSTYVFAIYERLFVNFILVKKVFVKIFRKNKAPKPKKVKKEDKELKKLVTMIEEDNLLYEQPTTQVLPKEDENVIKRPPLDDERS